MRAGIVAPTAGAPSGLCHIPSVAGSDSTAMAEPADADPAGFVAWRPYVPASAAVVSIAIVHEPEAVAENHHSVKLFASNPHWKTLDIGHHLMLDPPVGGDSPA